MSKISILFNDIYTKSIALFDDPKITVAYENNSIQFEKLMFTYLQNAIGLFQNPASIGMMLSQYMSPIGKIETFEADGINNTFTVNESLIDIINGNSLNGINFSYIENGEYVKGSYNLEEQKVSFPDILPSG